ncbi:Protein-methionine-sulfoxide reductase heme-binding subunit MsrQ [Rhizobiaceae bacterium]|nr:Protein-methionine-sulfoxide reductase heme-binding subunit MsrQ [Rhizobiaceae bacterium]
MTPWTDRAGRFSPLKAVTFAGTLVPALLLAWWWARGALGPRPLTEAIHETGDWAIRFLAMSLAVTPLRRIAQWPKLINVRRMLGLAALSYALLHLLLYVVDQKWDLGKVASEIALRLYLTIGFVALLGLVALGSTSTDAMIRRLGRNWNRLHKIVYVIAALAAVHFFMQTKADVFEATIVAGLVLLLMIYRLAHRVSLPLSSPVVLAGIAVAGAAATAAAELLWYGLATGIPVSRVFAANWHFAFQIRPMWWVLAVGLAAAALGWVRLGASVGKGGRASRGAEKGGEAARAAA